MSEPPREGSPPVAPVAPAEVPADADRAAAEALREAERENLEAAINRFNVNYNPNGGPPQRELPRLISPPNRRLGNLPNIPPWVQGGGPVQGLAQEGGQAHQPRLLQQLHGPRDNARNADGGVGCLHVNSNSNPDANTKESKYEVFET